MHYSTPVKYKAAISGIIVSRRFHTERRLHPNALTNSVFMNNNYYNFLCGYKRGSHILLLSTEKKKTVTFCWKRGPFNSSLNGKHIFSLCCCNSGIILHLNVKVSIQRFYTLLFLTDLKQMLELD